MRTRPPLLAAALVAALTLTGCADDSRDTSADGSATSSPSASPSKSTDSPESTDGASSSPSASTGTSIDITIKNGKVTPNGERVTAEVGEPVTLNIDADTAGELHVHSTPEQEIEFSRGVSTKMLTIEQPGVVDVEDHELEKVIVQLQVS